MFGAFTYGAPMFGEAMSLGMVLGPPDIVNLAATFRSAVQADATFHSQVDAESTIRGTVDITTER